jgi:hypothetical protein
MFRTIPVDILEVVTALVISLLLIAAGVFLFQYLWTNKYTFHFPKGRTLSARSLHGRRNRGQR